MGCFFLHPPASHQLSEMIKISYLIFRFFITENFILKNTFHNIYNMFSENIFYDFEKYVPKTF